MNTDFGNIPISKRALEIKDITDKIREIWRDREGPFANLFRILSYLIPFVPGLGWGVFVLERVASFFGWGMGDFGGALDKAMNLQPGKHLSVSNDDIELGLTQFLSQKAAASDEEMVKVAFIGGLLKMIGGIPKLANLIWKAVKFLLFAFGVTKIGDLYEMKHGEKAPGEELLEKLENIENIKDKNEESSIMSGEDVAGLMSLVKDPSKLIRPFIGM